VEDLLNRLALVDEFKVISRTSSDTYRERGKKKVPEIAAELGVSYIVEGSVQRHENKARITVQLIDAKNDNHIWTESYDRDLADVFKIQSEIAMRVASELSTELTEQHTIDIQKNYTNNPKAFELYQLGRFYWGKRNQKEYETAIQYFKQAINEDPDYALAYAGMADTYFLMNWGFSDINKRMKYRNKAEEYALKALELDENLAEAHTVLATLYFFIDYNWAKAEKTFLKALKLNPNYSTLHHRYSEHLTITGRHEKARMHINKAIELDPLSYVIRRVSSTLYSRQGLFQEALAEAQMCEELNEDNWVPAWFKFVLNYLLDDAPAAIEAYKHYSRVAGLHTTSNQVDSIYEASGLNGLIKWEIDLFDWPPGNANLYALLGEYDKALDLLELAFREDYSIHSICFRYSFKSQYSNPRFISLLKKLNLPWEPDDS
jgi:tetratricopeptide (TPR) repeat protein